MSSNKILLIKNNEVIGHSTDTVFGLIAKVDKENIHKINKIKGRSIDQPAQILFYDLDTLLNIADIDEETISYLWSNQDSKTSWLVKAHEEFIKNYLLDSFEGKILARIPEGEILDVLKEEKMLFATSANKTGEDPVTSKEDFEKVFPGLQGFGNQENNKASKIIDLTNNKNIIRN